MLTYPEIALPLYITQQILHHAQSLPHQEVCGLIGSRNGYPCSCYPIENTAKNPQQNFLLHEQQQIAAFVALREKKETLFAIYHSHPTAAAVPSTTDIALNNYPDALHLIISLNTKGVLELRGFKIVANRVQEVALKLAS
jgi:proteasome lid subunit RPN8/RPN11